MTLENLLSHTRIGSNQISERYSEYATPIQDQHVYYAYEPSLPHGHVPHGASSKDNYGSNFKTNASMSALTLLAFLFFLHILQQCIKEHMTDLNTSPLMVMTAGRENEDTKSAANKLAKIGFPQSNAMDKIDEDIRIPTVEKYNARNPFSGDESAKGSVLTKIKTSEPLNDKPKDKFKHVYKNDAIHGQN